MEPPDAFAKDDDPDRWLAEQRADAAIDERRRLGWMGRQVGESATFTGVLRDLAERASEVLVDGPGGRRHRGRLVVVAEDFVAVARPDGDLTLVRTSAVAAVRALDGLTPPLGDRPPALARNLAAALGAMAADRPRVVLVTRDGTATTGELSAVGRDVAVLRGDGRPQVTVYVPVDFVAEVSVVGSG